MTSLASTRSRRVLAAEKAEGISRTHRCRLLGVARTTTYYRPAVPRSATPAQIEGKEARMAIIDEMHLKLPATGARKMAEECCRHGYRTTRHQAMRLMDEMNMQPCYPRPDTSRPAKENPIGGGGATKANLFWGASDGTRESPAGRFPARGFPASYSAFGSYW